MSPTHEMEHRCGQRAAFNLAVRVWGSAGPVHVARLANVSLSGAFLRLGVPLDAMASVHVEVRWPTALSRGTVRLSGHVARQSPEGVGIEWDDFAPEGVVTVMQEFLYRPPADPARDPGAERRLDEAGGF